MIRALFGIIAFGLVEISMVPYIWSIVKGKSKPHRVTYFVWMILGVLGILSSVDLEAFDAILVTISVCVNCSIIFFLSLKWGMPGINKFDIFCLFGALVGFFTLVIFKAPLQALWITILTEFIGALPTFRKVFIYPDTEYLPPWIIYTAGTICNIFAVSHFNASQLLYPLYAFLEGAIIVILILRGRMNRQMVKIHE